jgi:Type II/IV secretion system protein
MNNGRDPTGKEEAADPTVIACVVFQTHDPQRHRPDRIILGEIRGGEAYDLLQLLNTGHSGSLSTVHATSARQALSRFTSCVLQSGVDLPYRAIKTNIGHSVNAVVQLERRPGRRFVSEAMQISSFDADVDEFDRLCSREGTRMKAAPVFENNDVTAPEYILDNASRLPRMPQVPIFHTWLRLPRRRKAPKLGPPHRRKSASRSQLEAQRCAGKHTRRRSSNALRNQRRVRC